VEGDLLHYLRLVWNGRPTRGAQLGKATVTWAAVSLRQTRYDRRSVRGG